MSWCQSTTCPPAPRPSLVAPSPRPPPLRPADKLCLHNENTCLREKTTETNPGCRALLGLELGPGQFATSFAPRPECHDLVFEGLGIVVSEPGRAGRQQEGVAADRTPRVVHPFHRRLRDGPFWRLHPRRVVLMDVLVLLLVSIVVLPDLPLHWSQVRSAAASWSRRRRKENRIDGGSGTFLHSKLLANFLSLLFLPFPSFRFLPSIS